MAWKKVTGLAPKRGAQRPHEERALDRIAEAIRRGATSFEHGGELYVKTSDGFVEWFRADPKKVGR